MKALLIGDASGSHLALHKGLKKIGVQSRLIFLETKDRSYASNADTELFLPHKFIRPFALLLKAATLEHYDVMSFTHRISMISRPQIMSYWDLPALRSKTHVMSYNALGCDEIALPKFSTENKYRPCFGCEKGDRAAEFCKKLTRPMHPKGKEKLNTYFDLAVLCAPDYYHVRHYFPNTVQIPLPIVTEEIGWSPTNTHSKKPLIVHMPSRRFFKGADIVKAAIDRLHAQDYDFVFREVSGVSYAEYLRILAESDIVIDQVWSQSPGMAALTSMAMGKIVFTGNTKAAQEIAPWQAEAPMINAPPDAEALSRRLAEVLDNLGAYKDFPERARAYVNQIHAADIVAEQYASTWADML